MTKKLDAVTQSQLAKQEAAAIASYVKTLQSRPPLPNSVVKNHNWCARMTSSEWQRLFILEWDVTEDWYGPAPYEMVCEEQHSQWLSTEWKKLSSLPEVLLSWETEVEDFINTPTAVLRNRNARLKNIYLRFASKEDMALFLLSCGE